MLAMVSEEIVAVIGRINMPFGLPGCYVYLMGRLNKPADQTSKIRGWVHHDTHEAQF